MPTRDRARCTKEFPWDGKTMPVLHVDARADEEDPEGSFMKCPNCNLTWSIGRDVMPSES